LPTLPHHGNRQVPPILRDYGTVILLAALVVIFSLTSSVFLTQSNIKSILIVQTVTLCVTLGVRPS
jgi:ribose/xylose/arabinose/galactoside ABC-type transport system permease subunit